MMPMQLRICLLEECKRSRKVRWFRSDFFTNSLCGGSLLACQLYEGWGKVLSIWNDNHLSNCMLHSVSYLNDFI